VTFEERIMRTGVMIFALLALLTTAFGENLYDRVAGISMPTNVPPEHVAGAYYTGDGLGYNLSLQLTTNGQFNCTWRGCLGIYGTSTGTWTVEANRITLKPTEETDMLKDKPMRSLDVLVHSNQYILVKSDDNEFFLKRGPSRYSCFQRREEMEK